MLRRAAASVDALEPRMLLCATCDHGAKDQAAHVHATNAAAVPTIDLFKKSTTKTKAAASVPLASAVTAKVGTSAAGSTLQALAPVNASKSTDNEGELDIAVNPANPLQVFAVSNSNGTGLRMSVSNDGGATFTNRLGASGSDGLPIACCDARVAFDSFGNLWMVYLNSAATQLLIARSVNGGASFTTAFTSTSGSWDNPSITVGYNDQVWVQSTGPSGQIAIGGQSTGLGAAISFPVQEYVPSSTSGGFGDIAVGIDGSVLLTYHTTTSGQGPTTLPIWRDADGLGSAATFVGGNVLSQSTNVGGFDLIPAQNQRSIDAEPGFAVIPAGKPHAGRIFFTYTDEAVNESSDTNVMLRYSDNNGVSWSVPVKINDDTTTRSQFMQSIAVDRTTGAVGLSWYDSRNDAGVSGSGSTNAIANDDAQFYGAFSTDGGDTFLPNVQISAGVSNSLAVNDPNDFGDWTGSDFYGGTYFAAWADNSTGLSPANTSRPKLDQAVGRVLVDSTPITGIAGTVFDDANVNGTLDTGEAGTANATVFLDANNNGGFDAGEATTTTNASGVYAFTTLTAGTYSVRVIVPAGTRLTTAPLQSVTIATDQFATNRNFGVTSSVSLSGVAFDDVNNNGIRDAGEPGLVGARVYIDGNNNGTFDSGTGTFASSNVPLTISLTGTPIVTSTLTVPTSIAQITKVTVTLNITHTFDSDLVLTLIAPDGTRVTLASGGGGSGDNYTNTTFDDAAATAITSGAPPFNGTYRPFSALSSLNGKAGAGTWKLEVADTANQDGGSLNSWSITVSGAETSVITNASGAYAFAPLPAGTYTVSQVPVAGYGFTSPASGTYVVTGGAAAVLLRDFGSRDLDRPLETGGQFNVNAPHPSVTITFTETVAVAPTQLTLTNLTTNTVVPSSNLATSFDDATHTATITFPGFPNGNLPDGDYRLDVGATVADTGGKTIGNPGSVSFYTLVGDADRNRTVDFADLLVLAQNYNTPGRTFSQGNFDYSDDGLVGFSDLLLLAQQYNKTLAAPVAASGLVVGTKVTARARVASSVLA